MNLSRSHLITAELIWEKLLFHFVSFYFFCFLGVAKSLKHLRQIMEQRCEVKGRALRIEKAKYCRREGKSSLGCPIAKYVIRR